MRYYFCSALSAIAALSSIAFSPALEAKTHNRFGISIGTYSTRPEPQPYVVERYVSPAPIYRQPAAVYREEVHVMPGCRGGVVEERVYVNPYPVYREPYPAYREQVYVYPQAPARRTDHVEFMWQFGR